MGKSCTGATRNRVVFRGLFLFSFTALVAVLGPGSSRSQAQTVLSVQAEASQNTNFDADLSAGEPGTRLAPLDFYGNEDLLFVRSFDWTKAASNNIRDLKKEIKAAAKNGSFLSLDESHLEAEVVLSLQKQFAEPFFDASKEKFGSCIEWLDSAFQSNPNHPGPLFFNYIQSNSLKSTKLNAAIQKQAPLRDCIVKPEVRFIYTGFNHQYDFAKLYPMEIRVKGNNTVVSKDRVSKDGRTQGLYVSVMNASLLEARNMESLLRSPFRGVKAFREAVANLDADFAKMKSAMVPLGGALWGVAVKRKDLVRDIGDAVFPDEAWVFVVEYREALKTSQKVGTHFPLFNKLTHFPDQELEKLLTLTLNESTFASYGFSKIYRASRFSDSGSVTLAPVKLAGVSKDFPAGTEHIGIRTTQFIQIAVTPKAKMYCYASETKDDTYKKTDCENILRDLRTY